MKKLILAQRNNARFSGRPGLFAGYALVTLLFAVVGNIVLSHDASATFLALRGETKIYGTDRVTGRVYTAANPTDRLYIWPGDTQSLGWRASVWNGGDMGNAVWGQMDGSTVAVKHRYFDGSSSNGTTRPHALVENNVRYYDRPLDEALIIAGASALNYYFGYNESNRNWFPPLITPSGPGSITPGSRYCQYASSNPSGFNVLPYPGAYGATLIPLVGVYGMSARNVDFTDRMACAEVAHVYNLMPSITFNNAGAVHVGGTTTANITPSVSQGSLPTGATMPTASERTQWRITRVVIASGATRPNAGGGISSQLPCNGNAAAYFKPTAGPSAPVTCATVAESGTSSNRKNTIFNADGSITPGNGSQFPGTAPVGALPAGATVCYALSVNEYAPYLTGSVTWRHSPLACNSASSYSLIPNATPIGSAVRSGSSTSVTYAVDVQSNSTGSTVTSGWSVMRVVVKPGNNTELPIRFGQPGNTTCGTAGDPYCDNMSCARVQAFLGSNYEDCSLSPDGVNTCTSSCESYALAAKTLLTRQEKIPDQLSIGTKVCFILALTSPATGSANRYSPAACVTVGKSPSVQVWGGDIRVGRSFSDDTTGAVNYENSGIYTSNFSMPDRKRYGSWVEYGAFAPSGIFATASLSGFAQGFRGGSALNDIACEDAGLNGLTFANSIRLPQPHSGECGHFGSLGSIPKTAQILAATELAGSGTALSNANPLRLNVSDNGRYRVSGGMSDIVLDGITIPSGRQIVLDARERNVSIAGNIEYANQRGGQLYDEISQVPQLIIIAKNITINRNVDRVDAWLIASGHTATADGTVKTCDVSATAATPVNARTCDKRLTINGPVMARYLQLWRTYGAEDGRSNCDRDVANPNCDEARQSAEIINLPGASLLWAAQDPDTIKARTSYTYELPPYF